MNVIEKTRHAVVLMGLKMVEEGLVAGTWGNVSCRVDGHPWIAVTPSGRDYHSMQPEDIVVMDLYGKIIDGKCNPSSEKQLHLDLYRYRDDITAIIHTHSVYASAFAVAGLEIPAVIEDMAQIVGGSVPLAAYAPPGTAELAQHVVQAIGEKNGVLMANHGVVGVGQSLNEAMMVCKVIEKGAQISLYAKMLGQVNVLADHDVRQMREVYCAHYRQL